MRIHSRTDSTPTACEAKPRRDVLGSPLVVCTLAFSHGAPHEDCLLGRTWRDGDAETTLWLQGVFS